MKVMHKLGMMAAACVVANVVIAAEGDIMVYRGPNIGTSVHPRKVFEGIDLSQYQLRAAANGTYYYSGDYDIINGTGRTIYLPVSQTHSVVSGTNRLEVKAQAYYKYSSSPYQSLQMNIVLEQRDDGVYAWCANMYQSSASTASEHQPYSWMYFRDMASKFGKVGSGNRVVSGSVGYDWRDISGDESDFSKGFGIDNLIIGKTEIAESVVADITGDIAVTGNQVIENPGWATIPGKFTGGGDLTYRATEVRKVPCQKEAGKEVAVGVDKFITKTWETVATNMELSRLTNVVADTYGTRSGYSADATGGYGFWKNDGSTASVQVYAKVSSGSQYQVGSVLQFRQSGTNIQASIAEAYSFENPWQRGYSFSTYKYGDIDLVLANKTNATDCFTVSITTAYKSETDKTPNGRAGLKNLRLYFADGVLPDVCVGESVYLNGSWMTVAQNRALSTLTNVTAITCGSRTGVATPAAYCHWRNNGSYATVQVYKEVNANYQTGSLLRFRQCGPNIQAAITPYSYNKPWENGYDKETYEYGDIDFEVCAATITNTAVFQALQIATTDDGRQSGLKNLKLYFDESQPQYAETTGLNNMTTGAVVKVVGTGNAKMWLNLNHTVDDQGLPKDGTLDVGANGIVTVSHVTKAARIYVHDGGCLLHSTNNFLSLSVPANVSIDGGNLFLGGSVMDGGVVKRGSFSYTALNNVQLANGALIDGHMPRVGYAENIYPYWFVCGSSPSRDMAGFRLYEAPSFVIDVEDVTASADTDFTIGGMIRRNEDEKTQAVATTPIIKIGAGTVSVTAEFSSQDRPLDTDYTLVVSNGMWRIAANAASHSCLDVLLKGGRLSVAEGLDVKVGMIGVEGDEGEVVLEDGARISLCDPTEFTLSDGAVNFTGDGASATRAIRVGTSACLSRADRLHFKIDGLRVAQDSDGYLEAQRGMMFIIR